MAEGFELVRNVRQHLRRGAALLDEGRFDEASAEVEAALALDAHSLPAQALRDRIRQKQAAFAPPASSTAPAPPEPTGSFVPYGVNAASWRGFEQRITERRFRALLDGINTAIVAGDAAAARAALEEARELKPDAAELAEFDARIAALPAAPPVPEGLPATQIWMRAMGAAALFVFGVSMLLGLEWLRPGDTTVPAPVPVRDILTPAEEDLARPDALAPSPVPIAINEDESVPAVPTPPEALEPRGTTGTAGTAAAPPAPRPARLAENSAAPIASRSITPAPAPRGGEVPDDFIAEVRGPREDPAVASATPAPAADGSPVAATRAPAVDAPVTADNRPEPANVPPVVTAAVTPVMEETRVEEVLRRYAQAYGELDASAARAVWPSVDEKALARAFQNLASQNVSLEDCEIDIRGAVANASCRGETSYVVKVGRREPRTEPRLWRFELRRDGDAWKIENAEARRTSYAQ